jgi:hypothetical protein
MPLNDRDLLAGLSVLHAAPNKLMAIAAAAKLFPFLIMPV